MNGAGRIGVDGDGGKPRPVRMHAAGETGCYGNVLAARPRPRRQRMSLAARGSVKISVLLVCAAAILMLSSIVMAPSGKGSAAPDEGAVLVRQPVTPYMIQGYVYEADGVTPAIDCVVNVTNKNTGAWNLTVVDPFGFGWYDFDLRMQDGGVNDGDIINVTVTKDLAVGWGEATALPGSTAYIRLDIVMSGTLIPEFPMVVVPVLGLMALFAVVSLKRRKDSAE